MDRSITKCQAILPRPTKTALSFLQLESVPSFFRGTLGSTPGLGDHFGKVSVGTPANKIFTNITHASFPICLSITDGVPPLLPQSYSFPSLSLLFSSFLISSCNSCPLWLASL